MHRRMVVISEGMPSLLQIVPMQCSCVHATPQFLYPGASKRMLGDLSPPETTVIWTDAGNNNITVANAPHYIPTSRSEGCNEELSLLCHADPRTMNTTLCLACVARVSDHFKACSTHRANAICTNIRRECSSDLDNLCKEAKHQGPAPCQACVRAHADVLFSNADNCTLTATNDYCGTPAPSPPGRGVMG